MAENSPDVKTHSTASYYITRTSQIGKSPLRAIISF